MGHKDVGTEHLLLGLLRVDHTMAAQVLTEAGGTLEQLKPHVAALTQPVQRHQWLLRGLQAVEAALAARYKFSPEEVDKLTIKQLRQIAYAEDAQSRPPPVKA
jgi:hypothetical protein